MECSSQTLQQAFEASFPLLPPSEQLAIAARLKWIQEARPDQIAPQKTDWTTILWACGRGWGKTRTGAEETWWQAYENPGTRIGIIAPTHTDVRRVCIEGESGLLACCPRDLIKSYNSSLCEITFWNGSKIFGYSSDVPERLRGPQHHFMWHEELAAWLYPQQTWDMAQFGLRLGQRPRQIITSTPKPIELVRKIIADPKTVTIHSSTYSNKANLPKSFFEEITKYEGTALGRQEIYGEVLDLSSTAVFKRDWWRMWAHDRPLPSFDLILQSYDTAFSEKQTADQTACTTWGLFKATEGSDVYSALLLDCYADTIGFPELRELAIKEFSTKYGTNDKTADGIIVENKGSGISLIQELRRANIPVYGYDPGGADKLQRAHLVSHIVAGGYIYIPETRRRGGKGQPVDWAKQWYDQVSYFGPDTLADGSKKDYVDSTSQFLSFMSKAGWMKSSGLPQKESYWKRNMKTVYG